VTPTHFSITRKLHTRIGASQWATVIAQAVAVVATTTAIATKAQDTTDRATAPIANSSTTNTLHLRHRATANRVRRMAPRPTNLQDRHRRPTMTNLVIPVEVASLSEAPLLADRATDRSRTSLSTPLAQGPRTASHPSQRAPLTRDLEGLTETVDDPATTGADEAQALHAVEEATAALALSRRTIVPF